MQRRDVLLAASGAGFLSLIGSAQAAPGADLIDDHWLSSDEDNTGRIDHNPWHQWLPRYVVESPDGVSRVRYGDVTAEDRENLRNYLDAMAATSVTSYGRDEQLAYWINLYNALTVDVILQEYPVASIRDITDGLFSGGPWGRDVVEVEGRPLSLDVIEHGIMRPVWQDPRIHYAVNCASIGCPNLASVAYGSVGLDAQMTKAAVDYINHSRGAEVDGGGRLVVSSIYVWFQEDFGGDDAGVVDHLAAYAKEPLRMSLNGATDIDDDRYDWALNDATGTPAPDPRYKGSAGRSPSVAQSDDQGLISLSGESGSGQVSAGRPGSGTKTEP